MFQNGLSKGAERSILALKQAEEVAGSMDKTIESYVPSTVRHLLQELVEERPIAKHTHGASKGEATKRRILDASFAMFISSRSEEYTMRNLACALDMRVGNLTYHYKSKSDLLENMVRDQLAEYAEAILACLQITEATPRAALERVISLLVLDLRRPEIAFFPQLWALSLHDSTAADLMDRIHELERQVISGLVLANRPDWSHTKCEALALHITAAIEGLTLFIGRNRKSEGIYEAPENEIIRIANLALAQE